MMFQHIAAAVTLVGVLAVVSRETPKQSTQYVGKGQESSSGSSNKNDNQSQKRVPQRFTEAAVTSQMPRETRRHNGWIEWGVPTHIAVKVNDGTLIVRFHCKNEDNDLYLVLRRPLIRREEAVAALSLDFDGIPKQVQCGRIRITYQRTEDTGVSWDTLIFAENH